MKLHAFLPSTRVLGIMALKNHLGIACDVRELDLGQRDQRAPDYLAKNPNSKMPMLEDAGLVLWESNAILFYLAVKAPLSGLWPSDAPGLGAPDAAFVARGERNFARFAAVLDESLKERTWLTGQALTSRQRMQRLADELAAEGLVEFIDNPKHQRSKLVRLTPKGDARYRELNSRLLSIASTMDVALSEPDIRKTTEILRHLGDDVKARSERLCKSAFGAAVLVYGACAWGSIGTGRPIKSIPKQGQFFTPLSPAT